MDGLLFDPTEYTDTGIAAGVLKEATCRKCTNSYRGTVLSKPAWYCKVRKSEKTFSGQLKVKTNQPACILITNKDNKK